MAKEVKPKLGTTKNPLPHKPDNSLTQLQAWQDGRVVKAGVNGVWAYTNDYRQYVALYFDRDSETESDPEQARELLRDYRREARKEYEERKTKERFLSITGYLLKQTQRIECNLRALGLSDDCKQRQLCGALATEWQTMHDDPKTSRRAENKWLDELEKKMYDYDEDARNVANELYREVKAKERREEQKQRKVEEINKAVQDALDRIQAEDV